MSPAPLEAAIKEALAHLTRAGTDPPTHRAVRQILTQHAEALSSTTDAIYVQGREGGEILILGEARLVTIRLDFEPLKLTLDSRSLRDVVVSLDTTEVRVGESGWDFVGQWKFRSPHGPAVTLTG